MIENKDSTIAFGVVAGEDAIVTADLLQYSSNSPGTCAFVADGGKITVSSSVAHARAVDSSIFCTLGGFDRIDAQNVVAVSENGTAVVLSGNTFLAEFTNCTLAAGGPAAIVGAWVAGGLRAATSLRVTSTRVTATGPSSPVLLFTLKDINAVFYNTQLIPSASNLLLLVACTAASQAGECTPFGAVIQVSESFIVGDIQA